MLVTGLGITIYGLSTRSYVQPPIPRGATTSHLRLQYPAHGAATTSTSQTDQPSGTPSTPTISSTTRPVAEPPGSATALMSPPVKIAIPSLAISSHLGPGRGLKANGTIDDAPLSGPTWSLPWWYNGGPIPGQDGSAVILGHVDSALGAGHLGVFFHLGDLRPGQNVTVTLANGTVTRWTVTSIILYPDGQFPDTVIYGRYGPPTLRLVTCGGPFDYQTHHYDAATVVTAHATAALSPP